MKLSGISSPYATNASSASSGKSSRYSAVHQFLFPGGSSIIDWSAAYGISP